MQTIALFVLVALCAAYAQADELVCADSGYALYQDDRDHCLNYNDDWKIWSKAKKACKNDDAVLYYPTTEAEYDTALAVLGDNDATYSWLGVIRWEFYSSVSYYTSKGEDFSTIWTGSTGLTSGSYADGLRMLEISLTESSQSVPTQSFSYRSGYWSSYCPFICRQDPCTVCCSRVCALLQAFQDL